MNQRRSAHAANHSASETVPSLFRAITCVRRLLVSGAKGVTKLDSKLQGSLWPDEERQMQPQITEIEDDDDEDDGEYCQNPLCENKAYETVAATKSQPHDSTRNYCAACAEAYYVGVQHGRHHEAAVHGVTKDRGSSQEPPVRTGAAKNSDSDGGC
jgi:hypothetical protein